MNTSLKMTEARTWSAGTLRYGRFGLVRLFVLLYLGYLAYVIQQGVAPLILPLLLRSRGFNASQIGTLLAIIPLTMTLFGPIYGVLSDRLRTPWGRRRPFLVGILFLWVASWLALPRVESFYLIALLLMLSGVAAVGLAALTAFYNDVVPPVLLSRFVTGLTILYSLSMLIFQARVVGYFDAHPGAVFTALALVGFAATLLMILAVPEGTYAEPEPPKSLVGETAGFLREGFANRYAIYFSLTLGMTALGGPAMASFFGLFYTDRVAGMGQSSEALGELGAMGTLLGLLMLLPAGWLVERYGPRRLWGLSGFLVGLCQIGLFAARTPGQVTAFYVAFSAINSVLFLCLNPMFFSYLPQARFGQMSAATAMLSSGLYIVGTQSCGLLIAGLGNAYRYAFIFGGICYVLVPLFLFFLQRQPYPYPSEPPTMSPDGKST